MTPAQRREARIALAMLPIGAAVLVISALAFVAVVALAAAAPLLRPRSLFREEVWCFLAGAIALWNARAGIALMSSFDWRPLPRVLILSAAVMAGRVALP